MLTRLEHFNFTTIISMIVFDYWFASIYVSHKIGKYRFSAKSHYQKKKKNKN